jgi:hypothetical protein
MFLYPTATNNRQHATEVFYGLRTDALRDALLEKLVGKKNSLLSFPDKTKANISNRKFLGVQEIPVDQVIGTLGRNYDFDAKFRPVKKHLRDRWVNIFISLERDNLPPILVHKVGAIYYVEDGHHRTSVARSTGRAYISAEVWEYSSNCPQNNISQPVKSCSSTECRPVETCPA